MAKRASNDEFCLDLSSFLLRHLSNHAQCIAGIGRILEFGPVLVRLNDHIALCAVLVVNLNVEGIGLLSCWWILEAGDREEELFVALGFEFRSYGENPVKPDIDVN